MKKLLSHPGTPLIEHLSAVAQKGQELLARHTYNFSFSGRDDLFPVFKNLVYLATAFHDLGKATDFFQQYIRNPDAPHDRRKSHALISAMFVYFLAKRYVNNFDLDEKLKELLPVFAFTAVKRHHGRLINISDEVMLPPEDIELLAEQVDHISPEQIIPLIKELLNKIGMDFNEEDWNDFKTFIKERAFEEEFDDFTFDFMDDEYPELPENWRLALFYFHQLLYAVLLFSDKNDVILSGSKPDTSDFTDVLEKISQFRQIKGFNNPKSEIDALKNKAYFQSLENLEKIFEPGKHIYSVTLPTGMGKTITTLALADKMRRLAGNPEAKIIITIPFTSIIDQNYEVYKEILQAVHSSKLLKHHHLAEPVYRTDERIMDFDESKFLIETWQSEVIVTTFVQLLETLFSCDRHKLMKLSDLAGAVIVLDEIQTVTYELWETIRKSFKVLGERYNMYFILSSATQPLIFNPGEDIDEIVPSYRNYFNFFNRTRLHIWNNPVDFESFTERFIDYAQKHQDKDILVIFNTKNATRTFFEAIREEFPRETDDLYFMTTLITPYERKKIIDLIKNPSAKRKIIVSTQLVEAGVDISVDTIFRQISPLDSIIQAAGRANRYNEKNEPADVFLFEIEELIRSSNMVYGSDLLVKTKNVLKNYTEISEAEYIKLIQDYFVEVRKQSDNTTSELLNGMLALDFSKVNLELIREIRSESVFIQLNKHARALWEKYVEIVQDETLKSWKREARFSEIKTDFYNYVINVPIPWDREHIIFDSEPEFGFYVSRLDNPSRHYHYTLNDFRNNTGYVPEEESSYFV